MATTFDGSLFVVHRFDDGRITGILVMMLVERLQEAGGGGGEAVLRRTAIIPAKRQRLDEQLRCVEQIVQRHLVVVHRTTRSSVNFEINKIQE